MTSLSQEWAHGVVVRDPTGKEGQLLKDLEATEGFSLILWRVRRVGDTGSELPQGGSMRVSGEA